MQLIRTSASPQSPQIGHTFLELTSETSPSVLAGLELEEDDEDEDEEDEELEVGTGRTGTGGLADVCFLPAFFSPAYFLFSSSASTRLTMASN